jgi:arylsulfatase A-like enzyme
MVLRRAMLALLAVASSLLSSPAGHAAATLVGSRPNVIVYLSDDQTTYSMNARAMPYLFGRPYGSWVTFDQFTYSTPLCCPSRASIMTGAYSYQVGVRSNTLAHYEDAETLPVWLQRAGYRTSLVGKYLNDPKHRLLAGYRPPGWSDWFATVGTTEASELDEGDYYDYLVDDNGTLRTYGSGVGDYQVDVLTQHAVDIVRSTPLDQPFYLQISPRNPHPPIEPAPRHADLDVPDIELPPNFNEADVRDKPLYIQEKPLLDPGPARREYRQEMRAMRSVDESLERIVEAVAARGQLDDTVIVFTSDNGYSRGSHRYVTKICPYEECLTGPLFFRYPGSNSRIVDDLVSNIDLAPTIAQLAGVTPTIPQDGVSLVPLLEGTATAWRKAALINWLGESTRVPNYWGVRTPEWKYVEYETGEVELYDLTLDPYELVNVASRRAHADDLAALRAQLAALRLRADNRVPSWP